MIWWSHFGLVMFKAISKEVHVSGSDSEAQSYLRLLRTALTDAFDEFAPDFILYNAGTRYIVPYSIHLLQDDCRDGLHGRRSVR